MIDDGSEYAVEEFTKPKKIRVPLSDDDQVQEKAVGENRDDSSDETVNKTNREIDKDDSQRLSKSQTDSEATTSACVNQSSKSNKKSNKKNKKIKKSALDKNTTDEHRYVLYVKHLNYKTKRAKLEDFFSTAGTVKSVSIPKRRKAAYAFVEMADGNGFMVNKLNYMPTLI